MKLIRFTAKDSKGEMIGLAAENIEIFRTKARNLFKLRDHVSKFNNMTDKYVNY